METTSLSARKPSLQVSIAIFAISVLFMGWLRLNVYPDRLIVLTYGLPLIICLWHRDLRLLWSMAAVFAVMSGYKAFFLLPQQSAWLTADLMQWGMQLTNITVIAVAVNSVVVLTRKLQTSNKALAEANEQLSEQAEELRVQAEELQSQGEELEQQNEELRQQGEELEQQREELQEQNEELHQLNSDITQRESILQTILDSVHSLRGEQEVTDEICAVLLSIVKDRAVAAGVLEARNGDVVLRAKAGFGDDGLKSWPRQKSLAGVAMEHDKTAYIEDLELRPDIQAPCPAALNVRSIIAAPLHFQGKPCGAIELYAAKPRKWTQEEFSLLEWAAAQCSLVLEALRLQAAVRAANAELETRVEERTAELVLRSEQLRSLAGELTLAEQRERQRLAQILHDGLQQLLAGARLRLNLLERARPQEVQERAAAVGSLISEAIEMSRSLTAELSPPILREGGLIPALEWLARWMGSQHELEVELNVSELIETPEDTTIMIFQAVRELLFNTHKHSGVKKACVSLERRGHELQVTVSDEGAGFDPERALNAKFPGSYGLFSVRERLHLTGGTLQIDSAPGKGSRFIITMPIPEQSGTMADASPEPAINRATDSADGVACPADGEDQDTIRIMLVDDHRVMLQGLAMLIGDQRDMTVVAEATSGEAAIELARKIRPEIVLMDISMPGMNGIEATARINAEFPEIQIIGLSMFEETERAEAMRQAGAVGYLTKNALASQIVEAIRACAGRSNSAESLMT